MKAIAGHLQITEARFANLRKHSADRDKRHADNELVRAAIHFLGQALGDYQSARILEAARDAGGDVIGDRYLEAWPWRDSDPHNHAKGAEPLLHAAALIAAEIDRRTSLALEAEAAVSEAERQAFDKTLARFHSPPKLEVENSREAPAWRSGDQVEESQTPPPMWRLIGPGPDQEYAIPESDAADLVVSRAARPSSKIFSDLPAEAAN